MAANWRQLLAPLFGLLLVAGCAQSPPAPAAPTTTAPATTPTTAAAAAQSVAPNPAVSPSPTAAANASTPAAVPSPSPAAQAPAAPEQVVSPTSGEIVVFAASSLTDAFGEMATAFQRANPNAKLTLNFGASSQLATQLGQGAKADVFASADQTQMDNAKKADAIAGQDVVFARNRLVLITPKDNPAHVASVKDLANPGLKFVTAQPTVPIGQYTAQMLDKAGADPTYGTDFKSKVEANTVSKEDNVRQVVSKIQLGEADAAIVYSTDATPQVRDQIQISQVPDPLQTLATYPIAVARGDNPAGGVAFVVYVTGPEGQAALANWGFLTPTATSAAVDPTPGAAGSPPAAAAPVLLAYARDGQPMGEKQGMARIVGVGDKRGGRYVSMVKSIELRDPGPAAT